MIFECDFFVISREVYEKKISDLPLDTCKNINSFEIWMYRKMLKISYTSHTTNEEVLKRIHEKCLSKFIKDIVKCFFIFFFLIN